MKLNFYAVKDDVAGEFIFFFQVQNDGIMKRVVKGNLLSKERNPFTDDLKDKSIYQLGELETITGVLTPCTPIFCCSVQEVRLELIKEIKIAKAEAGIEKPNADEVISDEQ